MTLLVFYIVLAIGVSFLCSVLEAVLLSVTPAYVGALQDEKPKAAARLKKLKEDIDRPLSAILTLNTIAHTIGAAGAGAQAAVVFGDAAVGIFSAVLTLGILVLSEIIPKTIGATFWRQLAPFSAVVLRWLILGLYPLVILSQWITRLISSGKSEHSVSREELVAMVNQGAEQGVFDGREQGFLKNLLRFRSLRARDVMTPRTVVVAFQASDTVDDVAEADPPFTRLPIMMEDLDHVTGYVLRDEAIEHVAEDEHGTPLSDIKRPMLTVPASLALPQLFDRFLADGDHIALVVDEYGGTEGVVTVEDVVETLLGLEIVDEADRAADMQQLARERWKHRAGKLGLVPAAGADSPETVGKDRDATIQYGITGGKPDRSQRVADDTSQTPPPPDEDARDE